MDGPIAAGVAAAPPPHHTGVAAGGGGPVPGLPPSATNVRGELVFSVMAAGRFCEKSGWIGKVEDVKLVL
jgi:hypothetical protein